MGKLDSTSKAPPQGVQPYPRQAKCCWLPKGGSFSLIKKEKKQTFEKN
jgi:hypothetical protein